MPSKSTPKVEPMLSVADLTTALNVDRRTVERLKSAGKLPPPDIIIGRLPRWRPDTLRAWIDKGGRP